MIRETHRIVLSAVASAPDEDTAILERLPEQKRGELLELSVTGKLLTVRTCQGEHILRMSMKQALSEMDPETGILAHRSVWLRKDQFTKLVYEGGNPKIVKLDGTLHAVSRAAVPLLRNVLEDTQSSLQASVSRSD